MFSGGPWGFANRSRSGGPLWTEARFLARREPVQLGKRHSAVSLRAVLYAPENLPALRAVGPTLGSSVVSCLGAFQVLVVQRRS